MSSWTSHLHWLEATAIGESERGKGLAHCLAVAGCSALVFDAGTEVGKMLGTGKGTLGMIGGPKKNQSTPLTALFFW